MLIKLFGYPSHRALKYNLGKALTAEVAADDVANLPNLTCSILRKITVLVFDHYTAPEFKLKNPDVSHKILRSFFDYQCGHTTATADMVNGYVRWPVRVVEFVLSDGCAVVVLLCPVGGIEV